MRSREEWEADLRGIVREAAHTRDGRDRWIERITGAVVGAAAVLAIIYVM